MAFDWDEERKEYVEVVKIANLDELGLGGGVTGPTQWKDIQNKPTTYPPADHNHDDRYNTKEDVQAIVDWVNMQMQEEQGKVAITSDDTPDFLENKVDNITLAVQNRELKVKSIDGLRVGVPDINNALEGAEENLQLQINDIKALLESIAGGMKFKDFAETRAEIDAWGNKQNGDVAVVLVDETKNNARSMYVYSGDLGMWRYIGPLTLSTKFTALQDTPSGYADGKYLKSTNSGIVYGDLDYQDLMNKPQSSITQIDDAVTKRHEHGNKATLDRIGIIEQDGEKILTIDGIPYEPRKEKKEIFSAYLSSTITVEANNFIKWDSVKPLSNIPYDPNTGLFTLTPGKSYKVIVSVMGEISNYITVHFARGAEKVRSNPYTPVYGATTVNNRGGSGVLATTFTIGESSAGLYGILVGEIGGKESVRLFNNRTMILIEEVET